MANLIDNEYRFLCHKKSDINEHLPTLYKYASECETVFETGVRGVVSSWALAKGLIDNNKMKKSLLLNDVKPCNIEKLLDATKYLPIEISHIWGNNLKIDLIAEVDMIFIDTWHVYGQLKRELEKYSKVVKKYIIMHDTTVDAISGESIRCKWDIVKQSIDSGFPENEITCGLQRAIDEFLANNNHWKLHEKFTNNNGLTILKRL